MSQPNNMAARLARIEAKLDEIAPDGQGLRIAQRLECAREAHEERVARDEPEPPWIPLAPDPLASWESQKLHRQLNEAHERMEREQEAKP